MNLRAGKAGVPRPQRGGLEPLLARIFGALHPRCSASFGKPSRFRAVSRVSRAAFSSAAAALAAALCLLPGRPAAADLKLEVTELAHSVDLSRGKEKFLTVTVDLTGLPPARLRRVQPLREDFQLVAGKTALPCRWLRGGSVPDDPGRLRFTLGFSTPPRGVEHVALRANLPRLEGEDTLDLQLGGLTLGMKGGERRGPGWSLSLNEFVEREYTAPSLPPKGKYFSKGGPVDVRVFRKGSGKDPDPDRALTLEFHSRDVSLYDATLDVSGHLTLEGGGTAPLLSGMMKRDPSRAVEKPPYPPFVQGTFHFQAPAKGRITGALIRLHRRPPGDKGAPVTLPNLPVP